MSKTTDEVFSEITKSLDDGFKQQQAGTYEKFGQDSNGRWTGKVISNFDPEFLGRVKIQIFGYYDELAEFALPWAVPDLGYIGGTNGNFVIPEVGTFVRGYFDQGDIQKPIYDSVAFSELTARNLMKNLLINKLENYPHKMVLMETDNGDYFTLNRFTGETVFQHRSGLNISVGIDGSFTINIGGGIKGPGNIVINCLGKADINTAGETNITAEANVNIDSRLGMVNLGRNEKKGLVNNIPICPITGMPHCVGNTNVTC